MAAEKSYYTELLLGSSQKLQTIRTEWDCLRLTAEQLSRMFDRPVIYALNDADKELDFRIEPADEHTLLEKLSTEEIGVAKWVQKTTSTPAPPRIRFRTQNGCFFPCGAPAA